MNVPQESILGLSLSYPFSSPFFIYLLYFYDKCLLKEFSILFSSEMDLGPPQHLRWSTFDNS